MSSFDCHFVRVEPDGRITVRRNGGRDGEEKSYALDGTRVANPPPAGYAELVASRLGGSRKPVRCEPKPATGGTERARFSYFIMQDKSGDIWGDVAADLIEAGLAVRR